MAASTRARNRSSKKPQRDIKQEVTDRVLQLLDEGTVPWRKPWTASAGAQGRHRSLATRKAYRGVNQLLLTFTRWESPWWLTFNNMVDHGGRFKYEAKEDRTGELVVFWKRISIVDKERSTPAEEKRKTIWLLKHFTVFNLDQVEGIEPPREAEPVPPIESALAISDGWHQRSGVHKAYGMPAYSPPVDTVLMPAVQEFKTPDGYHAAWFHEMVHSTGHADRLARPGITEPIDNTHPLYADEELVAEMGAAMLSAIAGLNVASLEVNTAAYIDFWRSRISQDKGLIVNAAARAQKAVDLITDHDPQYEEDPDTTTTEEVAA